jgi:hypothetical protein
MWLYFFFTVFGKTVPNEPLSPSLLKTPSGESISTVSEWEKEKPRVLQMFEEMEYGNIPHTTFAWHVEKKMLNEHAFSDKGTLELWTLSSPKDEFVFHVIALFPHTEGPHPLLLTSNFCPNHVRFPEYDMPKPVTYPSFCDPELGNPLTTYIFGEYIETFPYEAFLDRGIAFGGVYLAEGVLDDPQYGKVMLQELSTLSEKPVTGVIAAWAWTYIEILKVFEKDVRVDPSRTALYGHSRDAKAALLAAASSDTVDLVLAHQSGKGGASPWQRVVGETLKDVFKQYPHWFDPALQAYEGKEKDLPLDQQFLIALVAPRPVLVSAVDTDKWGDPKGAYMATRDAGAVYDLYGEKGPTGNRIDSYHPEDALAFFMRPSFHGVRASDWEAFFRFLDAHF